MEATMVTPGRWRWTAATYILATVTPPIGSFSQFVATLPEWEQELLIHTQLATDAYSIGVALEHGLRAVSDGSEWFQTQGSFGWILSSDVGDRLATGMGPARSSRPNSYQSEGYGMLALLSFLKRLAEYINLHEPWRGILATDSKSIIDNVYGPTPPPSAPFHTTVFKKPLDPLSPEWDVVIGIQQLLKEMSGLKLQHIRGHQDRTHDFHRLPLLAQLNVEADTIANQYQRDHGTFRPNVLLTKWAGAHLVLPSGTGTSNYKAALRYQATADGLKGHLLEKNKWTTQVLESINWQAHGKSICSHMNRRTHIIKLVHGILPTNSKLHRNDPIRSLCPCCRQQREDWWLHIMRCNTPSRATWRTNMLKAIDGKCVDVNTCPELRAILIDALKTWTNPDRSDQTEEANNISFAHATTPTLQRLITRQTNIGWHHLFLDRFCHEWSEVQDSYYANTLNPKKIKRRTGARWQKEIIGALWSQWFVVWEMRNHDLHGATESARSRAEREEVERTLRDIYDLRSQAEPSVQQLLCRDLTDHFNRPLWYNKNWLAIHGPLVKQSIKRAKKKAIQGVRSLRQYFALL